MAEMPIVTQPEGLGVPLVVNFPKGKNCFNRYICLDFSG